MLRKLTIVSLAVGLCLMGVTPVLAQKTYPTLADYEKLTGKKVEQFSEAPMLKVKVAAGELPPVKERISEEPLVVEPKDEIGEYGGTLRAGGTGPGGGGADIYLSRGQPLVTISSDLKTIVPNIAKGWSFSKDYKTFTIFLRKGMKWSDGTPFTADDFLFWYKDIILNDKLTPVKPRDWSPGGELAKVEKIDDYTVRFKFTNPYPVILDILTVTVEQVAYYPFAPKHYLKEYHTNYNPKADEIAKQEGFDHWWQCFRSHWSRIQYERDPNYPVLNPWAPKKTDTYGNRYFERNPYYWKVDTAGNQLPYADMQVRIMVENREVLTLKVIAGEFGYACQHTGIEDYPIYKQGEKKGNYHAMVWKFDRGAELVDFKFNLNHKDPVLRKIFNDLRFRQAMSLAIDRNEVNEVVFYGKATPRQATVLPNVSFYKPWIGKYYAEYDPEKANKLLDEMGLPWDKNHQYRLMPDGKTSAISLEYVEYAGARGKMLELVKDYWEKIGVKVALKEIQKELYSQRSNAGALDTPIWNLDATTEMAFHRNPYTFLSYCKEWSNWLDTNGKSGEEPPKDVKEFYDLCGKFQQTLLGTDEYTKIGEELISREVKSLWHIGIVGLIPKPAIIKNNLGNTPGEEARWSWDYRFWLPYMADQWFFKK